MTRIGQLRHWVTIETPVRSADGGGGADTVWQAVDVVWANVAPLSGAEPVEAEKLEARLTHRITLRWRGDVTAIMRMTMAGRIFAIESATDIDERRRWLECLCVEITA